jgi:hypothetical protein
VLRAEAMQGAPRFEPLGSGPFDKTHKSFMGDEIEWPELDPSYDRETRELGRLAFRARALDEQRSLVAFTELCGELCEAGAPIDVIGSMSRVIRDEALHVDLCDRMVKRLGGWDAEPPQPAWVRSNKKWPVRWRVLGTVLGSLCVGETISVAILRGCRDNAMDPVAHAVLTRMLADESFHARFGFWWLESMPLREDELDFATKCVRGVFGSVVRELLPAQTAERAYRVSPFGSMSPAERETAVLGAIEKTIVPGFESARIPAARLWAEAQKTETLHATT